MGHDVQNGVISERQLLTSINPEWPIYRSDRPADLHARWFTGRGLTKGADF